MKELRVALIGGGFMGKAHSLAYAVAPIAENLGARITKQILVDATPDLASALAEELGWAESSADWRETISRSDIDIVDICTPPQFHEEVAVAALRAGKHVFCEKPLTNSSAESQRMLEAARSSGTVTQVGFNYRHTPAVAFTKQLLDNGRFGTPMQIRASYLQETGFGSDQTRWRAKKATGGSGSIGDIGSHLIDLSELLFGDMVRIAARVRAKDHMTDAGWISEADRLEHDLIDEGGVWIAEFANGAIGSFAVSSYASGRKNRVYFEIDGSRGAAEFNWNEREEFRVSYVDEPADHRGFRMIHTSSEHPDAFWKLAGLGTGYLEVSAIQFQKFVRAIVSGGPADPDFGVGSRVQQIVETITRAADTGQWVDVPLRDGESL